jgi:NADH-quinone oxidoreductase subunit L
VLGFFLAWWMYIRSLETPKKWAESLSAPYKLLSRKYFVDELYAAAVVRPLVWLSDKVLWRAVDEGVIDGAVNGVARLSRESGDRLRLLNSGNTRSYASWVVVGAVVLTSLLLWLAG